MRKFVPYVGGAVFVAMDGYFLIQSFGYFSKAPGEWIYIPFIAIIGGLIFVAYKLLPPKPQRFWRRNLYLPIFLAAAVCSVALLPIDTYFLLLWLQSGQPGVDGENLLLGFLSVNAFTFGIAYLAWREWRADCRTFKESEEKINGSTSGQL